MRISNKLRNYIRVVESCSGGLQGYLRGVDRSRIIEDLEMFGININKEYSFITKKSLGIILTIIILDAKRAWRG